MDTNIIDRAVESLNRPDGVIVIPTDTTYGVICRLDHSSAIDRIYEIKGRDRSKPLIILGASTESLLPWAAAQQDVIDKLAHRFWPGALTIVAQAAPAVPRSILSGGTTVGLRVPAHHSAREVIAALPTASVASTSANPSGAGIAKSFTEVSTLMSPHVDYILPDADEPPAHTESTIIDITATPPRILRTGAIAPVSILQTLA